METTETPEPTPENPANEALRESVIEVLRSIFDPEIPVNIYELGLVYGIEIGEENHVKVRMTLTSPMCPVAESLPPEVEQKVRQIPGVAHAEVDLTWEPTWNPSMMSEAAKLQLGF
jgi:FeS assembly SUF system protein